ncbi:glutathione S-transferase family protein [Chroogloeocystis siderophila]|jgi:putative glutathione S-transferase|uniref:Glutathione-dependent reductase n=1 Tax=Chroogloeocystis siderophila 5.2 s.c.1 TaxID=247279 RepID=A0A1U7HVB4_9CHRO|nr:glutathione S-transferase family protein [Chroogloeocystis siderophila]OKH27468.1 glutathione-dependent reductase [Chroogloeocystis siderophila 5.2 s.c.1]
MSSTQDENKKAIATKRGKLPSKWIVWLGKFVWTNLWHMMMSKLAPRDRSGAYIRPNSEFRNFVSLAQGSSYPPAIGRYQLYVGMSCPWAHRTLVVRALKGLEDAISVSTVSPSPLEGGWILDKEENGCRTLAQVYQLAQPGYAGRSTVPVLWDKNTKTIVNNESSEIIAMLNSQFNQFAKHPTRDLYPEQLREKIDWWNEKIYHAVNNGVYRCGFAQTQEAYEQACNELFATLNEIDTALDSNRYLCGESVSLADVRLFTTLFRFDVVYHGLFKCNRRRIQDYPNLGPYLRDLYQLPGVAETCDIEAVKQDYYGNLFPLNPGGIIPCGPEVSLLEPHSRKKVGHTKMIGNW